MIDLSLIITSSSYIQWLVEYPRTINCFSSNHVEVVRVVFVDSWTQNFLPHIFAQWWLLSACHTFHVREKMFWRSWIESLFVYSSSTRDKRKCKTSSKKSKNAHPFCRNSDFMHGDGQNVWNVITIYVIQDLLSDLKTPRARRFAIHFNVNHFIRTKNRISSDSWYLTLFQWIRWV